MRSVLSFFQRSLFLQVSAIFVGTLTVMGVALQILLQTTLMFWLFPNIMEQHAEATSELVFLLENVPEEARPVVLSAFSGPRRKAIVQAGFPDNAAPSDALGAPFRNSSDETIAAIADREPRFRMVRSGELIEAQRNLVGPPMRGISALEVSLEMDDGQVLTVLMSPTATFGTPGTWLVLMIVIAVFVASLVGLRFVFRPLRTLEESAHAIGRTTKPRPIEEKGTEDLRRVTRALNEMQDRVQRLLADRSRMLAALAHDIRTSLTHMKLRLDKIGSEEAELLQGDVDLMDRLLSDMLLYARAEQPTSRPELVNIPDFITNFAASLPYPVEANVQEDQFWVAAERAALTRAMTNLTDNAMAYAGNVELSAERSTEGLTILVEDRGPGIPEAALEHIFDPFYRAEPSRNRETGGSGLGLTIARALLSAQGATLTVLNRPGGGTRATVLFPAELEVAS